MPGPPSRLRWRLVSLAALSPEAWWVGSRQAGPKQPSARQACVGGAACCKELHKRSCPLGHSRGQMCEPGRDVACQPQPVQAVLCWWTVLLAFSSSLSSA